MILVNQIIVTDAYEVHRTEISNKMVSDHWSAIKWTRRSLQLASHPIAVMAIAWRLGF